MCPKLTSLKFQRGANHPSISGVEKEMHQELPQWEGELRTSLTPGPPQHISPQAVFPPQQQRQAAISLPPNPGPSLSLNRPGMS